MQQSPLGLPVFRLIPVYLHAVATTPAGPMVIDSLIHSHRLRPSPKLRRVGSCIILFEACSAFTWLRPADSPSRLSDLLHRRLQQCRCLHCCSDCYRVERSSSRAGFSPAVDRRLFTAHSVLWIMIWGTSIWRRECSNRSKTRSTQKCYLCLRYVVSPHVSGPDPELNGGPGWT